MQYPRGMPFTPLRARGRQCPFAGLPILPSPSRKAVFIYPCGHIHATTYVNDRLRKTGIKYMETFMPISVFYLPMLSPNQIESNGNMSRVFVLRARQRTHH
ncbi:hypothetical protein [Burkholderia contaminans]|uniref:hypothetical protein n=1 Tax=Burkholderia contaminans TaxID=488447 RepID=UPI000F5A23F1|nr:hypothetical protein [Burkholderia contaminans]